MADLRAELEVQKRELEAAVRGLPDVIRTVQSEAVLDAYRDLVETSPRLTDAYVNEHVIESDGSIVHESANRVGPDTPTAPPTQLGDPTIPSSVALGDYAEAAIVNRRFYAAQLEYGSAASAPRYIYTQAGERARVRTEALASRASEKK